MLPLINPLVSAPSVDDAEGGSVCLRTVTGKIILVPCIKLEGCELSIGVLDEWQTGTLIFNGASIVELLGADSLSVREGSVFTFTHAAASDADSTLTGGNVSTSNSRSLSSSWK
ncbi:uncharacterized protein LOC109795941 [Cajanus cajan]|uniref:uncharacterized protein LOC109795941 n=1 Tax=Cajanus cajan TaxID=3821 RepID=UPI0010FB18C6|nr:uncharacterized protein LOC109795941 [Cajanus cajan]